MQTSTLPQNTDDRRLLADVSRWAHAAGWTQTWRGWCNARYEDEATVVVGHDEAGLRVWRKSQQRDMFPLRSTDYPADTIRQAVDILAAIGVLPPAFSSAYKAGQDATRKNIADLIAGGARTGQRQAETGELCTCGRQAVTVFTGGRFGDTGYCGLPDGGQPGPCRFCGGARHEGQRCPRYELRPAGSAS